MTRVIGGRAAGRRLEVPGSGTRPTSDRVREAVFSALESDRGLVGRGWGGLVVWDLFAGSGALGLEAASRGAEAVVLVDNSGAAGAVLRRNARQVSEAIGRSDAVSVVVESVSRFLSRSGTRADVVFLDPPYALTERELATTLAALHGHLGRQCDVVVERGSRSSEPAWPGFIRLLRSRRYGETTVWYGLAEEEHAVGEEG